MTDRKVQVVIVVDPALAKSEKFAYYLNQGVLMVKLGFDNLQRTAETGGSVGNIAAINGIPFQTIGDAHLFFGDEGSEPVNDRSHLLFTGIEFEPAQ